jgi:coatomer subunit beta
MYVCFCFQLKKTGCTSLSLSLLRKKETDASCKRNAFIMLYHCAEEKAVEYLAQVLDQVSGFGDILQLIVVELIRKVCHHAPEERGKFVRCIHKLLDSDSAAVRFESAGTLLTLSSAPTAIRVASATFIELLSSQSDNNVKMIVLDKLQQIKKRNAKVLRELLMDIIRALSCPNMDIRRKVLDIALDLVSPRNIDEVVQVLKKEVAKTQALENSDKGDAYRQLLIQSIHKCAVRFPEVANSVIHVLIDFVGDNNATSAVDVIVFIREVIETYDDLRSGLLAKLIDVLSQIKFEVVYRATLWVLAEYSRSPEEVDGAITAVLNAVGKHPLGRSAVDEGEENRLADESGDDVPSAAAVPTESRVSCVCVCVCVCVCG